MFLNEMNVEKVLMRHRAFWYREIVDRVCISVTAPAAKRVSVPKAGSDLEYIADPDFVVRREEARLQNTFFAGDALPAVYPEGNLFYPAWGGTGRFENRTVWVDPCVKAYREWSDYSFDPGNIWIKRHMDCNRALAVASKGRWLVATQGFFGAFDAMSLMRGYEDFLMDLIEDEVTAPMKAAQLKAVCGHKQMITRAWDDVEPFQAGTVTLPGIWAPGRINYWSADVSCMIGPADFDKWLVPEFEEMINLCEYSMYHLDGPDAVRHLPRLGQFKKLKGIQYTVGPQMQNNVQHWIGVARQIQSYGKVLFIHIKPEQLDLVLESLDPRGLFIFTYANNEEQAQRLVEKAAS